MLKVLLLSRYDQLAASARYRFYQYVPYLRQQGVTVTAAPLLDDQYVERLYGHGETLTSAQLAAAYAARLKALWQAADYDLVWLQMEALPWLPSWLELPLLRRRTPYVVDYDDAWFHTYDQHPSWLIRRLLRRKIDAVMKNAALVVAGNRYIAARATQSRARKIAIVPTVVDLAAYPLSPPPENKIFTIGWIGTPFTAHHLRSIQPALQQFCCAGNAQVVAIGAESLQLDGVNLQVKSWQQQTEAHELRQFDVGIMPLQDAAFERGKCGLKLIQYMAAARPVIATPVGVNQEIVKDGQNGFLATTTEEWLAALSWIKQDRPLGQVLGAKGRAQVEREFCLQITAPKIAQLLYQAAQKVPPHSLASLVGPHESASRLAKPQRESMIPAASGSRPLPANSRKESSQ